MQVTVQIPDIYFLEHTEPEVSQRIKLYTALLMYHAGQVSAGAACQIADVDRYTFLEACNKYKIPVIQYDAADVMSELQAFQF